MSEIAKPMGGMMAVIAAAVGGLVLGLVLSPGGAGVPDERAAIIATLKEQDAAWNAGDLDRFMQTYWDDKEMTFYSDGDVQRGPRELHARYRKRYQAEGKEMGKLTFSDLDVTMLTAERALARGRWKVETKKETLDGLFTLVLRKFPDGWKIVHDHTSQAGKKG